MDMKESFLALLASAIPVILVLLGLVMISVAGWLVAVPLGFLAGGLSCFAFQWYLIEGRKT